MRHGILKSALFSASAIATVPVLAQEVSNNAAIEEIIVTATKQSTRAQDTAIPLTVLSEDALERSRTDAVADLGTKVPSLNFDTDTADFKVAIRGVGSDTTNVNSQQGVALHQDGIYLARPASFGAGLYDTQRVEVLRGPQGTLYGRNATGGVINLVSNQPTNIFEANADFLYGDYDRVRLRGVINAPLVDDKLALRVTGSREWRDGYQENLLRPGDDGDEADTFYMRGQLRLDLGGSSNITLRASHYRARGAGAVRNRLNSPTDGPPPVADPRLAYKDSPEGSPVDQTLVGLDGTFDLGWATASLLVNYSDYDANYMQDTDASPIAVPIPGGQTWTLASQQKAHQYSAEARLSSNPGGPFGWLVGAFYFNEDVQELADIQIRQNLAPPFSTQSLLATSVTNVENESAALFTDVSYKLTDAVTLRAGARYTHDDVGGDFDEDQDATGIPFCFVPPFFRCVSNTVQTFDRSWDKFTWKAGLDWKLTRNNLLYATISTGYRAGGFNVSQTNPALQYYEPEKLTAYEVGSKNTLFDGHVLLNLSAFYYDYSEQQVTQMIDFSQLTQNAKSRVYGAEAEAVLRPFPGFAIDGHVSYLDAKYKRFQSEDPARRGGPDGNPATPDDYILDGNRIASSPRFSGHIGATFTTSIGDGELSLRGQLYAQTKVYLRAFNLDPFDAQKGYSSSDIIANYNSNNHWYIYGGVNNIENNDILSGIEVTPSGRYLGGYRAPRTWFVGAGIRF